MFSFDHFSFLDQKRLQDPVFKERETLVSYQILFKKALSFPFKPSIFSSISHSKPPQGRKNKNKLKTMWCTPIHSPPVSSTNPHHLVLVAAPTCVLRRPCGIRMGSFSTTVVMLGRRLATRTNKRKCTVRFLVNTTVISTSANGWVWICNHGEVCWVSVTHSVFREISWHWIGGMDYDPASYWVFSAVFFRCKLLAVGFCLGAVRAVKLMIWEPNFRCRNYGFHGKSLLIGFPSYKWIDCKNGLWTQGFSQAPQLMIINLRTNV